MGRFLDQIPLAAIAVIAIWMALAPLGQSHLVEKVGMLLSGTLSRPIDIFDLIMHATPSVFLVAKLVRLVQKRGGAREE